MESGLNNSLATTTPLNCKFSTLCPCAQGLQTEQPGTTLASLTSTTANLDTNFTTTSFNILDMSASALPQGFSIFQPTLGAQLQFFPAVGTQELDELIHAHLVGPASTQEKRATLALDFLEHAQMTGQSFKFYPVYNMVASPATSASSSFTSPATTTWDWSQTSRTASVSSHASQNRVSKPTSPSSRVRATDFSAIPGMKIMTKDGLDVTNSASRGSKTKEQRDHAHLMRIIKACDSCKRKKIRCDPSHKKRSAPAPAAAATSKVAKKARTASPPTAQTISPPQSISPASVSPPMTEEDFASLTASPFDLDASFSFDNLDAFAPIESAPSDLWDEFVQYPAGEAEDYDFFADPSSFLSQSSDGLSSAGLSVAATSPRSGAPGRPDGLAESHAPALDAAPQVSLSALPYEAPSSGDYTDFNLYSPGSSFSEDDRMLDISSSSSGNSTNGVPSPVDSPRRPPSEQPSDEGVNAANDGEVLAQSPFTRAQQTATSDRSDARLDTDDIAGALRVLGRSDIVMRTNDQGQLIICCPPGTVVVNSQGSSNAGLQNVSPTRRIDLVNAQQLTLWKVSTGVESSNSSFYIPSGLSVRTTRSTFAASATNPMKESAVATVSAAGVEASVSTWLDYGECTQPATLVAADGQRIPMQLADGIGRSQSSRFVHRNTDLAQTTAVINGLATAESAGVAGPSPVSLESPSSPGHARVSTGIAGGLSVAGGLAGLDGLAVSGSQSMASAVSQSSVDHGIAGLSDGHAHVESASNSVADGVASSNDGSLRDARPSASDVARDSSTEGKSDGESGVSTSLNEAVVSSAPTSVSTGRRVQDSEDGFEVSLDAAATETISQKDTTGIGRTLSVSSSDGQESVSAVELAAMMQTAITRTLLAAMSLSAQSRVAKPAVSSKACRQRVPRVGGVMAMPARVPAIC